MESTHSTANRMKSQSAQHRAEPITRAGTMIHRTQHLMCTGKWSEAHASLQRHTLGIDPALDVAYWDALVRCTIALGTAPWRMVIGEWQSSATHDASARKAMLHHVYCLLEAGDLDVAQQLLDKVDPLDFVTDTDRVMAHVLRGWIELRRGNLAQAHVVWQECSDMHEPQRRPANVALLALCRARTHAFAGRRENVARELLRVQRISSTLGDPTLAHQAAMLYVEALLFMGQPAEALHRLEKLKTRCETSEHLCSLAHYYKLMGWALVFEAPQRAQEMLQKALRLYREIDFSYHVMWCNVLLAAARLRCGDAPWDVFPSIDRTVLAQWPLLESEYIMLCGSYDTYPEHGPSFEERLRQLRAWAVQVGYWALTHRLPTHASSSHQRHGLPMAHESTRLSQQHMLHDDSVCMPQSA